MPLDRYGWRAQVKCYRIVFACRAQWNQVFIADCQIIEHCVAQMFENTFFRLISKATNKHSIQHYQGFILRIAFVLFFYSQAFSIQSVILSQGSVNVFSVSNGFYGTFVWLLVCLPSLCCWEFGIAQAFCSGWTSRAHSSQVTASLHLIPGPLPRPTQHCNDECTLRTGNREETAKHTNC